MYCDLYVDGSTSRTALTSEIARIVTGEVERDTVISQWGEIDVRINKEFDEEPACSPEDEFLFYRFLNEIEPHPGIDRSLYVAGVAQLVGALRQRGYLVVPACDFEEEIEARTSA